MVPKVSLGYGQTDHKKGKPKRVVQVYEERVKTKQDEAGEEQQEEVDFKVEDLSGAVFDATAKTTDEPEVEYKDVPLVTVISHTCVTQCNYILYDEMCCNPHSQECCLASLLNGKKKYT